MIIKRLILSLAIGLLAVSAHAASSTTLVNGTNVAIGTSANPLTVQFSGAINTTSDITTTGNVTATSFIANLATDPGTLSYNNTLSIKNSTATVMSFKAGSVGIGNSNPTGIFQAAATGVTGLYVAADGNVGLGTTGTVSPLTVLGPTKPHWIAKFNSGNRTIGIYNTTQSLQIGTLTNHNFDLFTNNGAAIMTLTTGKNVGLGITTPNSQFQLQASGTSSGQGLYISASTANDAGSIVFKAAGTSTCYRLFIDSAGTVVTRAEVCL